MLSAAVISAIATVITTALLGALVGLIRGLRRDVKRFMSEHLWLLATANWARQSITGIMQELGIHGPPPPEWPGKK